VPVLARLAEEVPGVSLKLLDRDENPQVMDRYLTDGTRSIPLVILLDHDFNELGHWGPRPAVLQSWVRANLNRMPKEERLREQRRWYARDRGGSVLEEILGILTSRPLSALAITPAAIRATDLDGSTTIAKASNR
jgi:hypothetical protein